MRPSLILHLRQPHISIIKRYNLKEHHRFQQADQYIRKLNYDNVTNFKDFTHKNQEMSKQVLKIHLHQQEQYMAIIARDAPQYVWTKQSLIPSPEPDDYEHIEDYKQKTLIGFFKECLTKRDYRHRLFLLLLVAIPAQIYMFFDYYNPFVESRKETIGVVNPSEMESFQLRNFSKNKELEKRMRIFAKAALTGDSHARIQ